MKKETLRRTFMAIATGVMLTMTATGCGEAKKPAEGPAENPAQAETGEEDQAMENVSVANPRVEITGDEARTLCTRLFKAPDGASDIKWIKLEGSEADSSINLPLVELDFKLDGMDFCARAQTGAKEDADISGMHYEWTAEEDVTLANWGMGNMQGRTHRASDSQGYADLITWYDIEIGIAYSLSVTAPDLDGFDIQAVAEQMYDPENEPASDMPEGDADSSNPVAQYAGQYYIGRGNLSISPEGSDGALIQVWWGSSAAEHSEWVMHGTFDEGSMTITYNDCEKHDFTLNEEGEVESDETAYTNGTGSIKINGDDTIVWTDDQDHIADDLVMTR